MICSPRLELCCKRKIYHENLNIIIIIIKPAMLITFFTCYFDLLKTPRGNTSVLDIK